jgi:hypothetical protein
VEVREVRVEKRTVIRLPTMNGVPGALRKRKTRRRAGRGLGIQALVVVRQLRPLLLKEETMAGELLEKRRKAKRSKGAGF